MGCMLNLRRNVFCQLHNCHPGVPRIKPLARSYVWWPNIERDIDQTVKYINQTQIALQKCYTALMIQDHTVIKCFNCCRLFLKMDWHYIYNQCNIRGANWKVTCHISCNFWIAKANCDWQWQIVYQLQIWEMSLA